MADSTVMEAGMAVGDRRTTSGSPMIRCENLFKAYASGTAETLALQRFVLKHLVEGQLFDMDKPGEMIRKH